MNLLEKITTFCIIFTLIFSIVMPLILIFIFVFLLPEAGTPPVLQ
ncbi:hypothetical protein [Metabacillus fastidiosus]|uniref:Uncharacterized protein n=1 Tax=Metabacillus fastidiosus TaxID=1458 RepID=A0ABU6NX47_9BACI|nr:hypothetical protein [Metabacillus fastidiosus]MED4401690.1 hypothetical protein [Metabacillus fastidiosus]MED4452750.1 hypothetical protein [Metabacillus fastidiosus]MED4463329.1 hypothetical protein [Metabacillus fastidiosus]